MLKNIPKPPVLTNPELLKANKIDYPATLTKAVNQINPHILEKTTKEQKQAKKTIDSLVKTLWSSMIIISNKVTNNQSQKQIFQNEFETKLIDFITHADHGIIHAYHVYKGMLYLDKKENNQLTPGSELNKQAQLMALLHDSMQVLPFAIKGNSCKLEYKNPKNEHACIIANITQKFGYVVGFNPNALADVVFGLKNHDGSYNGYNYDKQFDYVSKLLHDADKIFGASYSTDIKVLVSGMLKRNYRANKGGKGSYLLRELTTQVRDIIIYGDRCFSDSVSLVRKEFKLKMTTKIGKRIAKERRKFTIQQVRKVYGHFFDITNEFIYKTLVPELDNINNNNSKLVLSIVGMDQAEQTIPTIKNPGYALKTPCQGRVLTQDKGRDVHTQVKNITDLQSLITQLYNTPITIKDADQFEDRYNSQTDARGLKICVYNTESKKEYFIDPSIARFCFIPDGRTKFLELLTDLFSK